MVEAKADPNVAPTEEPAFERFFHDEYTRLCRALYLVTGDTGEAEDIAQEAMVRVFERWGNVSRAASPVDYLYRVALNVHRSRLRRHLVRRRKEPRPLATDPLGAVEDRREIGDLLARLPRGQREAVVLVEWLGMSAEEAASVLGIQAVSVRVRISRAKASLRTPTRDPEEET